MRPYLFILLCFLSSHTTHAATWLKAENGQWLYVDDYLPLDLFVSPQTEANGNKVFHGITMPMDATEKAVKADFEVREQGEHYELWYKTADTTIKIIELTEKGVVFFREHTEISGFFARKIRYFVKELPDNLYELWDAETNELIIGITQETAEMYKSTPDAVIMTIDDK